MFNCKKLVLFLQRIIATFFWCFFGNWIQCSARYQLYNFLGHFPLGGIFRAELHFLLFKATFHLTISMRGQRGTGKIQRNNYHHGSCGPSLTGKTMSVFFIFTQGTDRNVKNRWVRSGLWRRVGVKRQKKISFRSENSAQWKTTLRGWSSCSVQPIVHWTMLPAENCLEFTEDQNIFLSKLKCFVSKEL